MVKVHIENPTSKKKEIWSKNMQELEQYSKWRDNKNKATMWEKAQRQLVEKVTKIMFAKLRTIKK